VQSVKLAPDMNALRHTLPILLLATLAPSVHAQGLPTPDHGGAGSAERAVDGEQRRDGISLDEAVRMAEAQFHARVVRTDVVDEDGRKVYVLKLLSEGGRVITVRVDAASGRMR
jgi:uncharacterized membrane protein YkoI